jgi:chorismate mutase
MPKKSKTVEEHLQDIKYLLAAILLKKEPNMKEVAKVTGCSDNKLTELFPEKAKKKKGGVENKNGK